MKEDFNDIDDLIGKALAGEATPEEHSRLEAWVRLSEENQKYTDQLRVIFEKAASDQVKLGFDADAAWNKVKMRLRRDERVKNRFWSRLPSGLDSGSVSYGRTVRLAASIAIILIVGIFIYQYLNQPVQTFAVTTDIKTLQDTLPDGSTAFLNKKSSIVYEYSPRQKTRRVKLKGEGFFEVKHEEEKPFVIEAEEVLVRDIGTSFNVKAFPESDTVEVVVKTGEVQFYTTKNAGLMLKAGETGIYSKRLREFYRLEKIDSNALAYKTGIFSFNNTDLKSVIEKINEVYGCKIRLENSTLASCRLTVSFHNDTLDTVVEVISETLKLTVTKKGKEIILAGPGCN